MPNAFEAGVRKLIPAALVYVRHGNDYLMIHRKSDGQRIDFHEGKWNGPGGKSEADESPIEAARRELREEAGLDLPEPDFKPLGVIQFPLFKPHKNEDWIIFLFSVSLDPELPRPPITSSTEGEMHWIPVDEILSLNLWPGDRLFLKWVLENRPFMGTIWYRDFQVVKHWIQDLAGAVSIP